ncbi:terpenoid cyclases/Protein prenyltransferase [Panus rudis PR-1116 ss-1]|nr:terpenoid cyclases/Protein prenyltransferase [Panus rudis PR-1116 ss-1]
MGSVRPTPTDGYPTPTSILQSATENILKARIPGHALPTDSTPVQPTLQRQQHLRFLLRNLVQGFPARYVSQDASQPWLIFWTLQGFSVLGVGLDPTNKKKTVDTLLAMQHPEGGFCGGPGQFPHLLPTYAAVSAMAIAGQPGPGGGWDQIDRKKMYDFFMSLKQPDGSFLVSHNGEVDVRGIYCLLAVATLLNIATPELVEGTAEFVASCQTYEGGFGNASYPDWALDDGVIDPSAPRPPLGEAHGGYTFCAFASWVLLQPYLKHYMPASRPQINMSSLLRWLTQMQGIAIELGGFKGRTNKLVDGCYSWWVGGCVGLVEGLLGERISKPSPSHIDSEKDEEWDDVDDSVYNRKALQEYVLLAGQHPAGGLIDKPPKNADAYHTLYCLSGLSAAQHHVIPNETRKKELLACWADADVANDKLEAFRRENFAFALSWLEEEGESRFVGGEGNRLNATHPLFNLTVTHTENMMAHFYGRKVPSRYKKN